MNTHFDVRVRDQAVRSYLKGQIDTTRMRGNDPSLLVLADLLAGSSNVESLLPLDLPALAEFFLAEVGRCRPASRGIAGAGPVFMIADPALSPADEPLAQAAAKLQQLCNIYDAGALPFFPLAVAEGLPPRGRVFSLDGLHAGSTMSSRLLAERYLLASRNDRGELPHFIDRQPNNLALVPLIYRALPDAVFVLASGAEVSPGWRAYIEAVSQLVAPQIVLWPAAGSQEDQARACQHICTLTCP